MGPIVVGVDGSPGAEAALEWACAEAARHGTTLRVVVASSSPRGLGGPPDEVSAMEPLYQEGRQEAERILDRAVARVGDQAERVAIEPLVVDDYPARALIRAARGADLLVVGTRGRGGFAGLLLGSVSQQCVQHAPCPVVVVPSPRR